VGQILLKSGRLKDIASLVNKPVIAVDLGFARASKSCGIAWNIPNDKNGSNSLAFGACIEKVCELLKPHNYSALILEAPLSGMFSATGNPIKRGDFESQLTTKGSTKIRYWYSGPGAATCLAAVFVCRQLKKKLSADNSCDTTIVLFEGFISFKERRVRGSHEKDAKILRDAVLNGRKLCQIKEIQPSHGQSVVAITDVLSEFEDGEAPAILLPN
jgi:hypothetical protein